MVLCVGGNVKMTQTKLPLTEKHQSPCHCISWGGAGLSSAQPTEPSHQQGCQLLSFLLVQHHDLTISIFTSWIPKWELDAFCLCDWRLLGFVGPSARPPSCPPPNNAHNSCLTQCAFEPDRCGLNPGSVLLIVLTWADFFACVKLRYFISNTWVMKRLGWWLQNT